MTAIVSAAVWGAIFLWRAPSVERRLLVACFVLQLPVSAAAFYIVRMPLDRAIHALLGDGAIYQWGRLLYAPLTEEPAKLWPLLIPWIASRATRDNAVRIAAVLGLGFGVGEIGFLAGSIAATPQAASVPWYAYTGFGIERFMVCLIHGLLTAMTMLGWKRWRIGWLGGMVIGMALHLALNSPIALAGIGWLGTDPSVVVSLLLLWVVLYFLVAIMVLLIFDMRGARAKIGA